MKIVALKGPVNSGKTYTVNTVYTLLLNAGYMQVPDYFIQPKVYNFLGEKVYGSLDFTDILINGEKKVGITTGSKNELAATLNLFEKAGCAIAICACHDSDDDTDIVESYGDPIYVEKTAQDAVSLKRINDYTFAKKLISLV